MCQWAPKFNYNSEEWIRRGNHVRTVTEAARLFIFLARNEAMQAGAAFIEPEHLLLALLQEENSLLRRLLSAEISEAIQKDVREATPLNRPSLEKVYVPLSHSSKRVLAYGAEIAEVLRDPHIGPEHLLTGVLKETECRAAHILEEHGVNRKRVLDEIGLRKSPGNGSPSTCQTLNTLVATLPEAAVQQAYAALTHLEVRPRHPRQESLRNAALFGEMRGADPQDRFYDGRVSSSYLENGASVTETHGFFQGHEITMIERVRISDDHKILRYSQEIRGPKKNHTFDLDFDVS
jgi:Clp amino terminal domain, pathogenicity island component